MKPSMRMRPVWPERWEVNRSVPRWRTAMSPVPAPTATRLPGPSTAMARAQPLGLLNRLLNSPVGACHTRTEPSPPQAAMRSPMSSKESDRSRPGCPDAGAAGVHSGLGTCHAHGADPQNTRPFLAAVGQQYPSTHLLPSSVFASAGRPPRANSAIPGIKRGVTASSTCTARPSRSLVLGGYPGLPLLVGVGKEEGGLGQNVAA